MQAIFRLVAVLTSRLLRSLTAGTPHPRRAKGRPVPVPAWVRGAAELPKEAVLRVDVAARRDLRRERLGVAVPMAGWPPAPVGRGSSCLPVEWGVPLVRPYVRDVGAVR